MSKKLIALFLAVCLLAPLTSCGGGDTGTADTSAQVTESEADSQDMAGQRALVSDNLPEKDWEGGTFTTLIRTGLEKYFFSEESSGDTVADALYKRDLNVAERFNVKLAYIDTAGQWSDQANFVAFVRQSVASADNAFCIGDGYAAYITGLAGEKLFYNLNDMQYMDTTAPWWHAGCTDELTINGKCYFVSGDYAEYTWNCIFALIFNKQLAADYGLGDLYSVVSAGDWTLDYVRDICKDIYTDIDNDGKQGIADNFGFTIPISNNVDAIQVMFDCPITVKDSDGYPQLNLDDPRFITITEKLHDFLYNYSGIYCAPETVTIGTELLEAFKGNRALITTQGLGAMESLRTMDVDFGILPYPKLDSDQKEYHSVAGDSFTLFFVPVSVTDPNFVSMITEALCAESYRTVIPAYYDTALKTKYARDDESQAMIDLIRDSLTFNFGAINSVSLGTSYGPAQILRVVLRGGGTDFASEWAQMKKLATKNLEKLLEVYE